MLLRPGDSNGIPEYEIIHVDSESRILEKHSPRNVLSIVPTKEFRIESGKLLCAPNSDSLLSSKSGFQAEFLQPYAFPPGERIYLPIGS